MDIFEIRENIRKLVLGEFNERDNRDTDELNIIGDDYNNRLIIAQELELLKLIIYPYFKKCKYCGNPFEEDKVSLRGDDIIYCGKEECYEKWQKDFFSPEQLEWFKQFEGAKSASFTLDSKGNLGKYHIEK